MNLEKSLEQYRDMKTELQPALDALGQLEKAIKAHILTTGETADVDGVVIQHRNGYERTSWDSKALAGYAAAHPEIEQFKKVAQVGRSVTLKVTK